jgi:molybdate transport system permease protein
VRHTLVILVFAAASLTDALQEIGTRYERATGTEVAFNFAASSTLARQIEQGAPADLFLSADEATMNRVAVDRRVSVLANTLVVVVPAASSLRDWKNARSIALAEPSSVPAGIYARTWLQHAGLWDRLAPRVIPTENVRGALAAAASGNVDAAIVYRTDVSPRVRVVYEVPAAETRISYPFAVLANAPRKAEARRFLDYLQSDEAMGVFAQYGFAQTAGQRPAVRRAGGPPHASGALLLTLQTATLSTVLLLPPGLAVAWVLARFRWRGKSIVETLVALPLVMPPVATGLILLELAPRSVVFTWRAVVLAMLVMSFPLFVRAARVAFEEVNPRFEQIARTLGANDARVFFTITMPLAARGIVSGMLLAFARAVGEFGATILVAGNIPGRTSTLSLAIYNDVQLGRDDDAFRLLAISVVIAFAAVWIAEAVLRRRADARPS